MPTHARLYEKEKTLKAELSQAFVRRKTCDYESN